MNEILNLIKDKESEFNELYSRMDRDREAVHLEKYVLTGFDQYKNKEIPRTVSVTMNEPAVFANGVISVLQGAKRQTSIEGLPDSQSKKVENFIDDCLYSADEKLRKRRIAGLWAWACNHVALRGPIGVRWTFNPDGSPNCLPLDMRYCPFEDDVNGLAWAANHTRRNARVIRAEYGSLEGIPSDGQNIDVYDYWDRQKNVVLVSGTEVLNQPNPYGCVPFVIQFPPAGDYLLDDGYLVHWAESIFFLVRDLYPEWNRLMSIQQTKALEWVKPPYVHPVKDGESEPQEYPHKIGTNTAYPEGEEPHILDSQDETRAFQGAEIGISGALHKGSANIIDLADTAGIRNASWITEQTEIRDKILTPRTQALEMFYQQLGVLIIKEYQAHQFLKPVPLGKAVNRRVYNPAELGNPESYTIEFRYMPDNARQKLANYTVGLALRGTLSEDTIIRDIYQCDDPDGEIDKLRAEEARQANPIIFYYDLSARLIDVAKTKSGEDKKRFLRQARIMADSMVDAIKKQKMSNVDQPAAPETGTGQLQDPKGNPQALMAMPAIVGKEM
jgi:hypothetical protein